MDRKTRQSRDTGVVMMRVAAMLLILVLTSSCIVSGRYARYTAAGSTMDEARVTKFSVTDTTDFFQTDVAIRILPGGQSEQKILVENNSEVAVCYSIMAENPYENLPLEFEMKKGNTTLPGLDGYLKPGEKAEFTFVTKWNDGDNDIRYSGRVDLIRLTLQASQVD